ncbi:MAG: hypothetical protein IPL10_11070 [Bacteroidetes bacterium]|nr:hypothetical protein [Bacteroidota bacterium]
MTFSLKGIAFMVVLLFCFTVNFSQDVTVDFEGRVSNDNATLSESIVQVLQDGKLLTSFKTDQNGSYNVYLPLGSDYLISISKNNYVQKYFSVSTKGIPQDQAGVKLPAIRADVDLFKYYEGVDYSMFDEPISKFFYSSKKGNFDYDKEYLKAKKEEMKKVKQAEKKAIQLALQKNAAQQKELEKTPEKKEDVAKLNEEKKVLDEKLAKQSLMLKLIEEEEKPILKTKDKNEVELNIVAANNEASSKVIDKKINALVAKYKQGVTEEQQQGQGIIIIKRVVVRDQEAWVYEKKIFDWGGVSYFRDKQRITASTFNQETALVNK